MTETPKIAFIGAGHMATSIIKGLIQNGYDKTYIGASNRNQANIKTLHSLGIKATDNNEALLDYDIVILSVKPTHLKSLIKEIEPKLNASLLISIAAGITTAQMLSWFKKKPAFPLIRVMPNTPVQFGVGISAAYCSSQSDIITQSINQIFQAVGDVIWIENEADMDIITALSGSGPAYLYYFIESLIAGATKLGLPENQAKTLALKTVYGAAVTALSHPGSIEELREQVTSKGGTTESGLAILKSANLNKILFDTLQAASERGKTMRKDFS